MHKRVLSNKLLQPVKLHLILAKESKYNNKTARNRLWQKFNFQVKQTSEILGR